MKLIRIVDWSAHNSEAVVHQKHSSQTRCFVVPSRHTPFSYAKKCDLSLPPFIFPSPRPFLLQSELMNAVRCSPLCRVDSFLFFFFLPRGIREWSNSIKSTCNEEEKYWKALENREILTVTPPCSVCRFGPFCLSPLFVYPSLIFISSSSPSL